MVPCRGAEVRFQLKTSRVVGAVKGLRVGGPESDARPEAYVPVAQSQIIGGHVVVRTDAQSPPVVPPASIHSLCCGPADTKAVGTQSSA